MLLFFFAVRVGQDFGQLIRAGSCKTDSLQGLLAHPNVFTPLLKKKKKKKQLSTVPNRIMWCVYWLIAKNPHSKVLKYIFLWLFLFAGCIFTGLVFAFKHIFFSNLRLPCFL